MAGNSIKDALVEQALEDIDDLVVRLEALKEIVPSYFEQASNETADAITNALKADFKVINELTEKQTKQMKESNELHRRLNQQTSALIKQAKTIASPAAVAAVAGVSSFLGALLAVLLFS